MSGGGQQAQGFAAVPGIADINDAVSSIIKSGEVLVPALQSSGVALNANLTRSTAVLAGYGDATAGSINMQQQLLGLKPTDFKQAQLKEQFNQLQQSMVASGQGSNSVLMNQVAQVGNNLSTAYSPNADPAVKKSAFDQAMGGLSTIHSGTQSGSYAAPNNGYDASGAYTGNSNVNVGFVGNNNKGKTTGQSSGQNANTAPGDYQNVSTGNKDGNYSSASGFTNSMMNK